MNFAIFNNRKFWLGALLLLTVLAAIWPISDRKTASPEAKDSPDSSRRHSPVFAEKMAFAPLDGAATKTERTTINNLFPSQTWALPPSSTPIQQKPDAPPLPFSFGGRYTEGGDTMIFLLDGAQVYKVRQGETFKENYQVEKIEAASISIIYLPLGTHQILPTGDLLP
jgi:hypothetical protein